MLRQKVETRENIYRCGELVINCNDYTVFRRDKSVSLSAKEFQLLLYLVRNKGRVVTREQIENNLWHFDSENNSNIIDVYIRDIKYTMSGNRFVRAYVSENDIIRHYIPVRVIYFGGMVLVFAVLTTAMMYALKRFRHSVKTEDCTWYLGNDYGRNKYSDRSLYGTRPYQ